jgi:uncharacterized protein (DUF3084 family)
VSAEATWLTSIGAVVFACATGVAAYLTGRRTNSGTIHTSEPGQLWAENDALRKDMRLEIEAVRAENAALRAEVQSARQEVQAARAETEQYRQEVFKAHQALLRTENELADALRARGDGDD